MSGTGRPRSLLDDFGAAIASALAPHRWLGLVLVLTAPLTALDGGYSAPTWGACAGFVAGALLNSWRLVFVAALPTLCWALYVALPPFHDGVAVWLLTMAAAAVGAIVAILPRDTTGRIPRLALFATPLLAWALRLDDHRWGLVGHAVVAAATILAALDVSTRHALVAALILFATSSLAAWNTAIGAPGAFVAANAMLLALIAGRTAAALRDRRTDGDEAAARLVVRTQLAPWISCAALGALFVYVAGVMAPGNHEEASIARVAGLAVGGAFLHHLARGARGAFDRSAGLAVALAMAWPVAEIVFDGGPTALAYATALLVAPQILGMVLDRAIDREPRWTLPLLATASLVTPDDRKTALVFWLLAVVCAFHLVARSDVPARRVFWCACGLGVVAGLVRVQVHPTDHPPAQTCEIVGLWLVVATLALAARRARSMTAVPDDHPIRAEFAVNAERAAR